MEAHHKKRETEVSRLILNGKPIEIDTGIPLDTGLEIEDYTADDEGEHLRQVDIDESIKHDKKKKGDDK